MCNEEGDNLFKNISNLNVVSWFWSKRLYFWVYILDPRERNNGWPTTFCFLPFKDNGYSIYFDMCCDYKSLSCWSWCWNILENYRW